MTKEYLENAESAFVLVTPQYISKLLIVAEFLVQNQELAPKGTNGHDFGSVEYWKKIASKFVRGRDPRVPQEPSTVPDALVSLILQEYFGIQESQIEKAVKQHSIAMAAENLVGDLLERYIASKMEPHDWIWCSGEVVKKVDFLAVSSADNETWIPLQVKNRDNSENSSSSSVRDGTGIVKWFRSFSRSGQTNWDAFPEMTDSPTLSEHDFERFARQHLRSLKS